MTVGHQHSLSILPPRHDYGHQVMTGHDHVMILSHKLKSRDLKPFLYECRCDERLKPKGEESTFDWGTGTPKDRDEVNKREVCECDG
jgi:hypothetical protein